MWPKIINGSKMARKVLSSCQPQFNCVKTYGRLLLSFCVLHSYVINSVYTASDCNLKGCENGKCVNNTCECDRGWSGAYCQKCHGRASILADRGLIMDGVGNYSLDTKCSWLIKTGHPNKTLRLKFNQFATECGWDHLYIHDGDSAFAPLLAAYSGLLISEDKQGSDINFFAVTHQPYVYIHFYSDAAYTMSGFNISFSVGDCPLGCSDHGTCDSGSCTCHVNWTGSGCETEICPSQCNGEQCNNVTGKCLCPEGKRGPDCGLSGGEGVWEDVTSQNAPIAGRASHATVVNGNEMWVSGGYSLTFNEFSDLCRFNMVTETWSCEEPAGERPVNRYAHSIVFHENKLYLHGGVVDSRPTNETWVYDISLKTWKKLASSTIQSSGHVAHYFEGNIHVIFGYSPIFGYLNIVQLYNIANDSWTVTETTGATVLGGYGHTSVVDEQRNLIYIYGGYHSSSQSSYNLTDVLYSYEPKLRKWTILRNSRSPRYLHAAALVNDMMLVFGGNTHNDTSVSYGAKCYSTDFMAYDIKCNSWHFLQTPSMDKDLARYGHSMVSFNNKILMFGGFKGVMLNDIIKFIPGNCSYYLDKDSCEQSLPGVKCVWSGGKCKQRDSSYIDTCDLSQGSDIHCFRFSTCPTCKYNLYNCHWCHNKCTNISCVTERINDTNCTDLGCELLHSCQACVSAQCVWDRTSCNYPVKNKSENLSRVASNSVTSTQQCEPPCSVHTTCENCTWKSCMWCSNLKQCVETNSYVASYPYGQCTEWTTKDSKCPATRCSGFKSCEACQTHPLCGWCNDPTNTGLGMCMEGSYKGPILQNGTKAVVDFGICPAERWFFLKCPLCQCNGHSTCKNGTNICEECRHLTEGKYCEFCKKGYFGNPRNGGNCSVCVCNGQADSCHREKGYCNCRTRGVTGQNCETCDREHNYFGDPKGGGTCYYQLKTDYQFTFNLSKVEDQFYTQINFMNVPKSGDRDVDFTLNCSGPALLNITFKSNSHPVEKYIVESYACDFFRSKFEHKDYSFAGEQNTTFLVYVYDFQTPFWLQISFSQFPKIDLVHFFVTFFSCFLSLLLIAAALWKIKHKYDSYRRRQLMLVEMQQMASRPFSAVCIEIENKVDKVTAEKKDQKEISMIRRRKNFVNKPGAICLEPLHGNKAAVLTLIIQLPTGDSPYAPNGQSGIALGSSMITFGGNTRKQSIEHIKGEKSRLRKHISAPIIQHVSADHSSV